MFYAKCGGNWPRLLSGKNDENENFYINDYDAADRQGGE